jgi:dimethylargininase
MFAVPLMAITREVSLSINECEVSFQSRRPIDVTKAIAQHEAYRDCLAALGAQIVSLPAEAKLPDAVFVEDTAVVLDEIAIIAQMGALSRRPEVESIAEALGCYRPLKFLSGPATLDGGDVLRIGRTIYAGLSRRTNRAGIEQLRELVAEYDYRVQPIEVKGCLHLKSACSYLGRQTLLLNRSLIGAEQLAGWQLLDVSADEPAAANVLLLNQTLIMPDSFPKTRALLEKRGFEVQALDVSELQKAEAGVTCCSLIF